jgi:hypothetical protein
MKTEKKKCATRLFLFLFVSSLMYPGILQQDSDRKQQEPKSLIMKELLVPRAKSLPPPKRNIFTRQRPGSGARKFDSPEGFPSPGQIQGKNVSPDQNKKTEEEVRINVRYIGYVQSGKKVVAVIILEGQTYAVESGDILDMGVTIGEITPDDLEIIDKSSQSKRIRLEGE